ALDFGDLIYRLVVAIERDERLRAELQQRFEHVLVDEFQDTNHVQYRFLRALCAEHRNLTVVGDDDQSIYRWRGADRRNILDFRNEFPNAHIVKLEQNYRSTQRILRVANGIITRNSEREPKELWTENDEGARVAVVRCDDERDEARLIVRAVRELGGEGRGLAEMVVFYRIHAQSRVIEEALRAANIPYRIVGGMRFYDRAEVKDALAYLRSIHNPDDDVSLLRIINTPARGIGKTTIEKLMDLAARRGLGVWAALEAAIQEQAVGAGARKKLAAFRDLMRELRELAEGGAPLTEVGHAVVERSGYGAMLRNEDTPEADARLQNLEELLGSMSEFGSEADDPTLANFLELVTLQSSVDEMGEGDRLTLMTVHAAKGLEFPVVMVAGLEERMFPFKGADPFDDPEELEEERRLAYVALTRARERLILSWAGMRRVFGQTRVGEPSRFLDEIPSDDVEWVGGRPHGPPRRAVRSGWGGDAGWDAPPRPASRGAAAAAAAGEPYVDRSEGDLADALPHRGMRVRHAKFGVGRVRDVGDGMPPRVTVEFPGWGTKNIVATYLEPA
ncbi:MAG: ATP-dependent helicase, partial [Myxococcota bacterium]